MRKNLMIYRPVTHLHTLQIVNLAKITGGLNVVNLEQMGLGNLADIKGVSKKTNPIATYGILKMKSKGKDTTTGHWELMGLILDNPFKTYKKFDDNLIEKFIAKTKNYNFIKSNFLLQKDYISKFPDSQKNFEDLFVNNSTSLLKTALEIGDNEIINDYHNFLQINNFSLALKNIILLKELKEEVTALKNSKAYKIGKIIISPLKILKKIISKTFPSEIF